MGSSAAGNVVAVVQARLGSTRLPGKVLLELGGRCVLRWVVGRLRRSERLDSVVVATGDGSADDAIAARCGDWGVPVFRGSNSDVLGRFVACSRTFGADLVVRVNADNPLVDPAHVDALVAAHASAACDYASYRLSDGRPVMLAGVSFFAETISRACLERADAIVRDPFEREHVTLGIYRRPDEFDVLFLDVPAACDDSLLRLTLDTADDLELLQDVFALLAERAVSAGAEEVVRRVSASPGLRARMASLARRDRKPRQ